MTKQAVLLIHGIGEQRPMDTLRSFVDAVWTTDTSLREQWNSSVVWSKPYSLTRDFELRRLTTPQSRSGVRTDFFELYWAHLMRGTRVRHVLAWAKTLLIRWPWNVPRRLKPAYWVLLGLILGGGTTIAITSSVISQPLPGWLSFALSTLLVPAAVAILTNVVGDAARYLHVAPANVRCRHQIRSAGVDVLAALHASGYERIIVVGHSLGSVIGHDILYHAWALYNGEEPKAERPSYDALGVLEAMAAKLQEGCALDVTEIQAAQRAYFNELKANGSRWRVSDFVTLGSPLTHSEVLMATNASDLRARLERRELAHCLPQLESRNLAGQTLREFAYESGPHRLPHHAAVFGPTRWTNLYFPNRFLIRGDLVGGPLAPLFGGGVRDVAVTTRLRLGLFSHTLYWSPDGPNEHLDKLRLAVDLLDAKSKEPVRASSMPAA